MNWNFDLPNDWFENTRDVSEVYEWKEPYGVWSSKIVEPYLYKTDSGATMLNLGLELLNFETGEVIKWNPKFLFRSGDEKGNKFGWEKDGKVIPFEAHNILGTLEKLLNVKPLKNIQNTTIKDDWSGNLKEIGLLADLIDKQIIIANKKKYDDFKEREVAYLSNIFDKDMNEEELENIKEKINKQIENYVYKQKDKKDDDNKEDASGSENKDTNPWGA